MHFRKRERGFALSLLGDLTIGLFTEQPAFYNFNFIQKFVLLQAIDVTSLVVIVCPAILVVGLAQVEKKAIQII